MILDLNDNSAALIYTEVNRKYFTGFQSSLGYLFVTNKSSVFLVDYRYYLEAKNKSTNTEVRLLTNVGQQINDLIAEFGIKQLYVEEEISVSLFNKFKKTFVDAQIVCDGTIDEMIYKRRSVKTSEEIEFIETAQSYAENAFEEILNFIKPGVTEKEIACHLEYHMKKCGAEGFSFDTIAVSGVRTSMPHGTPTDKRIENGDFVTMDFGAIYNGYHSDMTRTVAVGHATEKMIEVYDAVLLAQKSTCSFLKPGVTGQEIDSVARNILTDKGFGNYFTHSTGHSVGLEIHETPNAAPKSEAVFVEGNIITVEPGVYIDNLFGVRIEDMCVITKNGCKNLTKSKKSLIVL